MQKDATRVGGLLSNAPRIDLQKPTVCDGKETPKRSDRRERWHGARTVAKVDPQEAKRFAQRRRQIKDKSRALAIHHNRRRRGPLKTHWIGRYLNALADHRMFLQFPVQLLSLPKNLAMICSLIMLSCCRYGAAALRAERQEIADWLGIHRDTVTRYVSELVRTGLLTREERFIDQPCVGRGGRKLRTPQIANWYSPGPVLRCIWREFRGTFEPASYSQGMEIIAALGLSMDQNNSLDPVAYPHRRKTKIRSNAPPAGGKESAKPISIKKPAAPAENSADKRAAAVGPSNGASLEASLSKTGLDRAGLDSDLPGAHRPATYSEGLLHAYQTEPALAELLARAMLTASLAEKSSGTVAAPIAQELGEVSVGSSDGSAGGRAGARHPGDRPRQISRAGARRAPS